MKKYLAVALLTYAGINSIQAADASKWPTPQEAHQRIQSKKAQRRQQHLAASSQDADRLVAATVAFAAASISSSTEPSPALAPQPAPFDAQDAVIITLEPAEDLSQSIIITQDAAEKLRRARELEQQQERLHQERRAVIEALRTSHRDFQCKVQDAQIQVSIRKAALETLIAEEKTLQENAHSKSAHAEQLAQSLADLRQKMKQAIEEAELAAQTANQEAALLQEKKYSIEKRRNSLSKQEQREQEFSRQIEQITKQLRNYEETLDGKNNNNHMVVPAKADVSATATQLWTWSSLFGM